MKTIVFGAAILLASCLNNPSSAPEISAGQIEGLGMELRVGKFAAFAKDKVQDKTMLVDSLTIE